jgi:serine/threonine protein kinase
VPSYLYSKPGCSISYFRAEMVGNLMANKSGKNLVYRSGSKIGSYTLIGWVGGGGNAEVWEVEENGKPHALKILKGYYGDRVPRFRDEVAIMKRLSGRPGVLPMLRSEIPDTPSKQNPCWILRPIGKGIIEVLQDDFSPEKVINAIFRIAKTLEELHREEIYHRDIKPDNLFLLNGEYAIGDFGLVDFPDKNTNTGRQLGSRNYIAPEMLNHANDSNGGKADVYSLAKTLWSLLSGNAVPPGGAHSGGDSPIALRGFLEDFDRIDTIDRVLEMATHLNPAKRLSMKEFAEELEYWLKPEEVHGRMQKNEELAKRFQVLSAPAKSEYQKQLEFEEIKNRINSDVIRTFEPIQDALRSLSNDKDIRFNGNDWASQYYLNLPSNRSLVKTNLGSAITVEMNVTNKHTSIIRSFWFQQAFAINFFHDGKINLFACHLLAYRDNIDGRNNKQQLRLLRDEIRELKFGAPSYQSTLNETVNSQLQWLENSFEKFLESADAYRGDPGISRFFY